MSEDKTNSELLDELEESAHETPEEGEEQENFDPLPIAEDFDEPEQEEEEDEPAASQKKFPWKKALVFGGAGASSLALLGLMAFAFLGGSGGGGERQRDTRSRSLSTGESQDYSQYDEYPDSYSPPVRSEERRQPPISNYDQTEGHQNIVAQKPSGFSGNASAATSQDQPAPKTKNQRPNTTPEPARSVEKSSPLPTRHLDESGQPAKGVRSADTASPAKTDVVSAGQAEEIVMVLQNDIQELKESCLTDQKTGTAEETALRQEVADLKKTKEFLLQDSKKYRGKNTFLRKLTSKQKDEIAKLKKQLAELKQSAPKSQAKAEQKPTAKAKGPALPRGWRIIGLCPTLVSLENREKQKSVILEIGDSIEGVKIVGINVSKNAVVTDHGIAKYR
jgi:hypothetical protein